MLLIAQSAVNDVPQPEYEVDSIPATVVPKSSGFAGSKSSVNNGKSPFNTLLESNGSVNSIV